MRQRCTWSASIDAYLNRSIFLFTPDHRTACTSLCPPTKWFDRCLFSVVSRRIHQHPSVQRKRKRSSLIFGSPVLEPPCKLEPLRPMHIRQHSFRYHLPVIGFLYAETFAEPSFWRHLHQPPGTFGQ